MASEWARKKAGGFVDGIADDVSDIYGSDGRKHWVESLAAALDEARAEGARRRAEQDDVLAGVIAKTRAAALKEGAERERWECHRAATVNILSSSPSVWNEAARVIADRIAARGPMRGPEEV